MHRDIIADRNKASSLPATSQEWDPQTLRSVNDHLFLDAGPSTSRLPRALWRAKWWLLLSFFLGTLGGFVRVVITAPTYGTFSVVEVMDVNTQFMGMSQLDPTGESGNSTSNIQTQIRIVTSSTMLNRVIQRVNLEMTPITNIPQDIYSKLRIRLGVISQDPIAIMKQALQEAATSTRVRPLGASRLLEISCESSSPEVAAAYVNTLATEYVSQNSQNRSANALRTTQWLEGQLEETKGRIEQSENKLQEFVQKEGVTFVLDQQNLADSKMRQLQADLSAMQADRIAKQSRWELARSSAIDSLPEILDDGRMKELRGKLTELRRERAQLTATLTPAHYKVQRIDAQISEIEQTLQKEQSNLVQRIQNEYDAAMKREKMTSESYYSQSRSMAGQAGKGAQYALLKRDVEMARQIYNTLLQQANQANIVASLPTNNIRIIDQAVPNGIPSRPKPSRDIPMGAVFGLALGVGAVFGIEHWKARKLAKVFSEPGHIASGLRLPELGVIPNLGAAIPDKRTKLLSFVGSKQVITSQNTDNPKELIVWRQRASFSADSFRYTLTSLIGGERPPQLVIITSPGPGEGKTTFSTNLAAAAASTGKKTLLIDGDVRRARLHTVFDVPLDPGLTELLTTDRLADVITNGPHIRSTRVPGMYFLPAGSLQTGESPAEILFSAKLAALLTDFKREFDLILVDTAPALHFPDARLLGKFSDGVVLVIRSGVTLRETANSVAQRFIVDRVPVLGTVLNDWTSDGDTAYGYATYDTTKI